MISIEKISRFLPAVEKPTYRQTLNKRLMWTGVALSLYFLLASITIFGVAPTDYEQFRFFEIILGAKFGSLMTLGIGPIVTAGIIMQLLVGSKILKWDMTKPENRKKFQTWNKFLATNFCFFEAAAFVLAGALPVVSPNLIPFVIFQLALGGFIVILLDELVSKWGFGSGVSLFIAAGVGKEILVRLFSPFTATCQPGNVLSCLPTEANPATGLLWGFLSNIFAGKSFEALINILPLLSTILVFLIVVFVQHISINIPLAFSSLRGFGRTWSLKLLYTSNIPVILAAALLANLQLIARFGLVSGPEGACGALGCFDKEGQPISGVVYYLSPPTDLLINAVTLNLAFPEILRAITYMLFMAVAATIFSVFWVSTAGMDARSVAEQIEGIGMRIPGYRSDRKTIEMVLNRYIPSLAVLSGLIVGLLAAFGDFTGALGTGTGILLTVMIIYNHYERLRHERLEEAHPIVRRMVGE